MAAGARAPERLQAGLVGHRRGVRKPLPELAVTQTWPVTAPSGLLPHRQRLRSFLGGTSLGGGGSVRSPPCGSGPLPLVDRAEATLGPVRGRGAETWSQGASRQQQPAGPLALTLLTRPRGLRGLTPALLVLGPPFLLKSLLPLFIRGS